MNAKEFRLCNYVEFENRIFQIDTIAEVFPTLNTAEFGIGVVDWNNLKPIPLTEEWLIKFGGIDTGYEIYIKAKTKIIEFKWSSKIVATGVRNGWYCKRYKHIKYVHQLQNLYFTLTGEELTIKSE